MANMQCCWNEVRFLECTTISKVGHGTQLVGLGIARFRAIFAMKGKKLVPQYALETMAMGKQGAMLYGLTQSIEF